MSDSQGTGASSGRSPRFQQELDAHFENGQPLTASRRDGAVVAAVRSLVHRLRGSAGITSHSRRERDTRIYVDQGYVDARITYPISSPNSGVRHPHDRGAGAWRLSQARRSLPAARRRDVGAMVVTSSSGARSRSIRPGGAPPRRSPRLGIAHILTGYDHLLFLLCLVIPLRGWRQILSVVTAFTVAHSFTLLGSAFDLAPPGTWFPPFVETAIAASIVYMALENIMGVDLERRILITGLFGLVHGFGFSYGLQENFQFAGTHLLVSLFAFNIGIELGQILVLAGHAAGARSWSGATCCPGQVGMIILSAIVADTGWHWMLDRAGELWATPWPKPTPEESPSSASGSPGSVAAGGIELPRQRLKIVENSGLAAARARARRLSSLWPRCCRGQILYPRVRFADYNQNESAKQERLAPRTQRSECCGGAATTRSDGRPSRGRGAQRSWMETRFRCRRVPAGRRRAIHGHRTRLPDRRPA